MAIPSRPQRQVSEVYDSEFEPPGEEFSNVNNEKISEVRLQQQSKQRVMCWNRRETGNVERTMGSRQTEKSAAPKT